MKSNIENLMTSIPVALILSTSFIACDRGGSHPRRDQGPPPADKTSQPTEQQRREEAQKAAENEKKKADQATKQAETTRTPPIVAPPPRAQQRDQQTVQRQPDQKVTTATPSDSSPAQPSSKPEIAPKPDVLDATFNLPEITPLDTFGGQLLAAYLSGEISGEQVISQVFDNKDLAMSNLAEMSAAVWTLRQTNRYSDENQAKVLILEGAMTRYLNEELRSGQRTAAALEYGTAIALGTLGGLYSPEILRGLQRIGASPVVQIPWGGIQKAYSSVASGTESFANWFRTRWTSSAAAATEGTESALSRSTDMFRRTMGFASAPATAGDRQLTVFHNIYRVINSPQLAKGYRVDPVAQNLSDYAKKQTYVRTGIPGFQISQPTNKDYLFAQLASRGGEPEYYRVTGVAIKAVTKDGSEKVIPAEVMTETIGSRLRNWGQRTSNAFDGVINTAAQGVKNSRPVRYMTTDPMGRRIAQGVAVGAPISAMTLLALRPIDTSYVTLDSYVRELESEGLQVDLDHFVDKQREKALSGR